MELKSSIYKRETLHGKLAVHGEKIEKEDKVFFRKTYDLQSIKNEDKKSTYQEARMTVLMSRVLKKEKYFPHVLNYGEDFIETEFIPGKTIASILDMSPLSIPPNFNLKDTDKIREVFNVLKSSESKLKILHKEGIVHHDLHLDNIIIVRENGKSIPVFIDFEKSKEISDSEVVAKTQIEFDRKFILQAILLIGLRMEEFREEPLFKEAFRKKRTLFRELKDMNLEECINATASTSNESKLQNQREKIQKILW